MLLNIFNKRNIHYQVKTAINYIKSVLDERILASVKFLTITWEFLFKK